MRKPFVPNRVRFRLGVAGASRGGGHLQVRNIFTLLAR